MSRLILRLLPWVATSLVAPLFAGGLARQVMPMSSNAPADISVTNLSGDGAVPGSSGTPRARAYRVMVENKSGSTLRYEVGLKSGDGYEVVRTLEVPATTSRFADITVAVEDSERSSWSNPEISVSGPGTGVDSRLWLGGGHSGTSGPGILTGLSTRLFADYAGRLEKAQTGSGHSRAASAAVAEIDPANFSADWRSYSGMDVIVMTADDWRTLAASPESREAMLRYVGRGGRLNLLGVEDAALSGLPGTGNKIEYGFGVITLTKARASDQMKAFEASPGRSGDNAFSIPTVDRPGRSGADPDLDRLEALLPEGARAGILLGLIIVGFAILVGPVNLFVFCKGSRRHRMLWLTPLIALATSVLLSGYIFIADGVGGQGFRRRLRLRPAGAHAEFLVQEQSSRTGLLIGTRFDVPAGALLRSRPRKTSGFSITDRNDNFRIVDGTATGDWFRSRYAQNQTLELWDAARGGIALSGPASAPVVLSTLDGTLDVLYVRDAAGEVWKAGAIAPGARTPLKKSSDAELSSWMDTLFEKSGDLQRDRLLSVSAGKGRYYAESRNLRATSPETLGSIRWENLPDILVGNLDTGVAK